jgi:hypothetical protein
MIFLKKKTKKEWTITAKEAKALAKELDYIADEANSHNCAYPSRVIFAGDPDNLKIPKRREFRIVALPDQEVE